MVKYKNDEQRLKNAILDYIQFFPRKGFAWSCYNGGVYSQARGTFLKPSKYKRKGVPDINGIWCGRPLFIEVKAKEGVLSDEQTYFLNQAEAHGAIAFVCRDLFAAIKVLEAFEPIGDGTLRPKR